MTMRVLMVGMYPGIGGVESFVMNYFRHIDRTQVMFDFINAYDELHYSDEIINFGGRIFDVSNFKKNPVRYYHQLVTIMKEYDIVHIQMLSAANILPVKAAKAAEVKHIIVHSHNGELPNGCIRQLLHRLNKRYLLANANHFFACSELAGRWLFGDLLVDEGKLHVIPNAIDLERYQFDKKVRDEVRFELGLDNAFVIGHVGRFAEQKNHHFLISVFNDVHRKRPNSVLLLIGDGDLKPVVKEQVDKLGLKDNVRFLGIRQDVDRLMQAMDVFILPSLFEGLPVAGIEAQASGLSCVFSSEITSEVGIENVIFIHLAEPIENWVDAVLCDKRGDRSVSKSHFKMYHIENSANDLSALYMKMI